MREYKIDIGNSSTGQVGAVAYIRARSKADALQKFKSCVGFDNNKLSVGDGIDCLIYFNPGKITLQDVECVR